MSHFELKSVDSVTAQSSPFLAIVIRGSFVNRGPPCDVTAISYWISDAKVFGQGAEMRAHVYPTRMSFPESTAQFCITLPVTRETLRQVEDRRAGAELQPLSLLVTVFHNELFSRELVKGQRETAVELPGPPKGAQIGVTTTISRDDWGRLLKALAYEEFEIVEVPVRQFRAHPPYEDAVRKLREAQEKCRRGDWNGCVQSSRLALEALGHDTAVPERQGQGPRLDDLLNEIAPGPAGEPRRKALDHLALALRDLRHPTAHMHLPGRDMERPEAELALTTALAIFRYVGERWSRP